MTAQQFKALEQQILQLLNNSGLPVAGAYYLLKSILLELELLYEHTLLQEAQDGTVSTEEQTIETYQPMPTSDVITDDIPK